MTSKTGLVLVAALAMMPLWSGALSAAPPPPDGGTIAIEPRTADGEYDPAMPSFVDAASKALTARGFTVLEDPAHAAYAVELTLGRAGVGTGLGRDPNGATPFAAGVGAVVPFSTGHSSVVTLRRTRLELRIKRRGADGVVWDGTAVTVRATGTQKGTDQAVAADLSAALLEGYPAQPTEVVGVP